jgi:hypothetical protein
VTRIADPHLRRGAGSLLLVAGTAGVLFALTAPGGSNAGAPRTIDLGAGVRTLDVDLAAAKVRVVGGSGDRATLHVLGGDGIAHTGDGSTSRVRCEPGADCSGATLEVRLPARAGVRARLGSGSVSVTGVSGALDLRGASAALSAIDARPAALRASTRTGAIHISLAAVPDSLEARTATAPISISVPYAYKSDGYAVRARTRGHLDLDITDVRSRRAPRLLAGSESGDILITQRYPNLS